MSSPLSADIVRTIEDLKSHLHTGRHASETDPTILTSLFATAPFVASSGLLRLALADIRLGLLEYSIYALDNPYLTIDGVQVLYDTWCIYVSGTTIPKEEEEVYSQAMARARRMGALWTPSMETMLSLRSPDYATARLINMADIPVPTAHVHHYTKPAPSDALLPELAMIAHRLDHADWLRICTPYLAHAGTLYTPALVKSFLVDRPVGCLSTVLYSLPAIPQTLADMAVVLTSADWDALIPKLSPTSLLETIEQMKPEYRTRVPYQHMVKIFANKPTLRTRALAVLNDLSPNKPRKDTAATANLR